MVMNISNLDDALDQKLRELLAAEKEQVRHLPRMARECEDEQLKEAFEQHAMATQEHVNRLQEIFEETGRKPRASKSESVKGLIEDEQEIVKSKAEDVVKEAAMIAAAQQIEHFEIACYGTCATWAKQLGYDRAAELLQQTLEEEKSTDRRLSEIAQQRINEEASQAGEE
jgi:ferritin-like metal-binding protein YciE